jgi:hypothetical protein
VGFADFHLGFRLNNSQKLLHCTWLCFSTFWNNILLHKHRCMIEKKIDLRKVCLKVLLYMNLWIYTL